MQRTDIAAPSGVIPLWAPAGALEGTKPVVLVITGAWAEPQDMMKTPQVVAPAWDAAVIRLPGNDTPWLAETSIEAWARAVEALIGTVFSGRPVVLVGLSVGALVAVAVRSPQVRRILALEPPLVMSKLWPLLDRLKTRWRDAPDDRPFLAAVFGVTGAGVAEERTWFHLFEGAPPTDVVVGDVPLTPPRPLPRSPSFLDAPERAWLRAQPNVRLLIAPETGHNIHVFAPLFLREALLTTLDKALDESRP